MEFMKTITSTEARQNFSTVLSSVSIEPVGIFKQNKEIAVLVSSQRYRELERIEDLLYGKAAELAIQEGFCSDKEADDLLNKIK